MAANRRLFDSKASFRLAFPVLVFLFLVLQIPATKAVLQRGAGLGTDDAMRLVEVRDLLAGQAWYDLVQHRVLPPDGLSMHWSRYIDGPMAAIVAAVSPLTGPDMALRVLAVLWPLALAVVFMALTARLARHLFGWQAAILSLFPVLGYALLSNAGFSAGATDHHSVQIILMLVLCSTLVLPERPLRQGIIGGLAAALSLAVGLEMILFIGLAGMILVTNHTLDRPGSAGRLMGFAAALALATPVLMAGQVDPDLWTVPRCDAISPPLIAVTSAAFVTSACLVLLGRRVRSAIGRLGLVVLLGAIASVLLLPAVQTCAAGPYTAMSPEVQRDILGRIQEIKPALFYLKTDGARAIAIFYPFYVITLLFAAMVLARRGEGGVLLCFLVLGAVLSFWQMRMTTMGLPVIAVAFGGAMSWVLAHPRPLLRAAGLLGGLFVMTSPQLAVAYVKLTYSGKGPAHGVVALGQECMTIPEMARLDAVPAGIVFNPLNLGPMILLASHHSVTAAPYHRRADAFINGILPFEGDEDTLREAVRRTRADYLLFCAGNRYGTDTSIGTELSKGGLRLWLAEVPLPGSKLRLLKVTE